MGNELVRYDNHAFALALEVGRTAAEAGQYGTKNAAELALRVQYGMEIGLGPAQALNSIHVVKGKPSLTAGAIASKLKEGRYDYRVTEHTETACTVVVYDRGREAGTSRFTMEDAQRAGLLSNNQWKAYPKNMLFSRAITNAARWYAADVFGGSVYTPDELGAHIDGDTGEVIAPVPDEPVDVVTGEVIDIEAAVRHANRDYQDDPITPDQRKRLFAIAREHGLSETALKDIVAGVTGEATTKSLTKRTYEEVVDRIESAEAHVAAMPRLDPDDPVDGDAEVHPDQERLV